MYKRQIRSYNQLLNPIRTGINKGPAPSSCTSGCSLPNLFSNPDQAWASFRTPHPGETGSRNPVRMPNSFNIDAGLAKSFDMPWKEGHKVTFRWDVFNVTNTPFFGGQSVGTLGYTGSAATGAFGRFTFQDNSPRVMQFAFRYDF